MRLLGWDYVNVNSCDVLSHLTDCLSTLEGGLQGTPGFDTENGPRGTLGHGNVFIALLRGRKQVARSPVRSREFPELEVGVWGRNLQHNLNSPAVIRVRSFQKASRWENLLGMFTAFLWTPWIGRWTCLWPALPALHGQGRDTRHRTP